LLPRSVSISGVAAGASSRFAGGLRSNIGRFGTAPWAALVLAGCNMAA